MNTEWLLERDLKSFDEGDSSKTSSDDSLEEETFSKYGSQKCTGNEDEESSTDEEDLFQSNGFVGNEDEEDDSSNSSSDGNLEEGSSSEYGSQKYTWNEHKKESSTDKRDILQSNGFVDNEDEEDLTNERSSEFSQLSCLNELSKNGSLEEMFSNNSFEIDNKVFEDYLEKIGGSFGAANA
ncbi:hypothetical protein NE237_026102 [Protea cynaroides]|uniref:Uncharacterized protein n=1 Tax=Protea cynaroides TaxID=273540 RepID=A0A9Q0H5H8_9MAGN|nr:hypothetical protein NE237_026102 [Protea cynaroides]